MLIAYCPFLSSPKVWNLFPGFSFKAFKLGAACKTISRFLACRSKDWKRRTRLSLNSFSVSRQENDLIIYRWYYARRNMSSETGGQAKRFNGLTTAQIFWIIEIRPYKKSRSSLTLDTSNFRHLDQRTFQDQENKPPPLEVII